ncbi:ribonuclease E/G, partial [Ameyamaea chiangmaiensis]
GDGAATGAHPDQIGLLRRAPSPVVGLAERWADARIAIDDPYMTTFLPTALHARLERVRSAFDSVTDNAVGALYEPTIALTTQIRATITPTPALTAIDMDMNGAEQQAKQTAQFAANREALAALGDQIRLRALGGAILVDPAGLQVRKRTALLPDLHTVLERDPEGPRCLGITQLGLFEIVRPRREAPLHERDASAHGRALAMARVCAAAGDGAAVEAGLSVLAAWDADSFAQDAYQRQTGRHLTITLNPSLPPLSWRPAGFTDHTTTGPATGRHR